jgi:hypothetical protein
MAPYLLFYPVFDEAEALAGMPHCEVVDPPPQYRIDQLNHPVYRLGLIPSEHLFELAQ